MKLLFTSRCLYAVCFLMFALPVLADSEQDQARKAVMAGEVMPLEQFLREVGKISPGKVLKVKLEQKDRIWVYKIKLLRDDGMLSKLCFDARDGIPLESGPCHGRHGRQWGHRDPGGWENREGD